MIILVAALTKDRVIASETGHPWNIPEEEALFQSIIYNKTVILGRKTWEAIPKPSPHRNYIVVSGTLAPIPGVDICKTCDEALKLAYKKGKDVHILGGVEIFEYFLPIADRLYLSWIKKDYKGNRFFPEFNEQDWKIITKKDYEEFTFCKYKRITSKPA